MDWYIGTAEHELLTSDHDVPTDPEKPYVFPERFPVNENYNWREENYPCFPGMVHLLPDHWPDCTARWRPRRRPAPRRVST